MTITCAAAVVAAKNVGEYLGPATVRIVTGKPDNEVEEVISQAVRDSIRRVLRRTGFLDSPGP